MKNKYIVNSIDLDFLMDRVLIEVIVGHQFFVHVNARRDVSEVDFIDVVLKKTWDRWNKTTCKT